MAGGTTSTSLSDASGSVGCEYDVLRHALLRAHGAPLPHDGGPRDDASLAIFDAGQGERGGRQGQVEGAHQRVGLATLQVGAVASGAMCSASAIGTAMGARSSRPSAGDRDGVAEAVLDIKHDLVRLENGEVCASSTPWAKQFQGDFDEVAKRSEVFERWVDHRHPLRLFTDGREMFLAIDCVEIRAASFTRVVPPPGWEGETGVSEPLPQAGDVDHSEYECDYIGESGRRCESVFSSYMAMCTHRRTSHWVRSVPHRLAVTNCCPFCMTTFASR